MHHLLNRPQTVRSSFTPLPDCCPGGLIGVWPQMPIDVQCGGCGGVAHPGLHCLDVGAGRDQQTGQIMPQIMTQALRAEGLDPDDPDVRGAIDLVRWELSLFPRPLRVRVARR